jgi:hypothetical protein
MSNADKLLALINADNPYPRPLTFDTVSFSAPLAVAGDGYNTKVTVSSVPGKMFIGNVDVFYHRIELTELGYTGLLSEAQFTPESILASLNAQCGTDLTLADVEGFTVPTLEVGEPQTVVLTSKSDSFAWAGEKEVELLFGLPMEVNELHQLVTFTMPSDGYLTS